ncbi:MAG TPA: DUF72 domain-containing protein [Terriglobales bacterium]|nr:DUF72 domain-containing protein [Terriglobales bacterium]
MQLRIGTSGWHYKHWRGSFYDERCPASGMLASYVQQFDAVEINNTFYRLPKAETLRVWRDCTPPGFCFALKASRFITHNKKLKDPQNALDRFLPPVVEGLGKKLGPILFQLPPAWAVNAERLEQFLAALPKRLRYAFEFRHPSWHVPPVCEVLRVYNAAFCIFELAGLHSPLEITADFAYVRLHGPGGKYQGSYSDQAIAEWAARIRSWRGLREVHVYFDNDQAGYAAENALRLKQQLLSAR